VLWLASAVGLSKVMIRYVGQCLSCLVFTPTFHTAALAQTTFCH